MSKGAPTADGKVISWLSILRSSFAESRRGSMSESSVELIATVGAVLAFLSAAAAGITSRRDIRLVAIGVVFLWLPLVSEVRRTWIAEQGGNHERTIVRRPRRADRGPEVDRGCVGGTSRTRMADGGSRGAPSSNARCR